MTAPQVTAPQVTVLQAAAGEQDRVGREAWVGKRQQHSGRKFMGGWPDSHDAGMRTLDEEIGGLLCKEWTVVMFVRVSVWV